MFQLHPTLEKDTILIKDLKLCRVLLSKNALYPWLVLVPRKPDLVEMIDLNDADQTLLMQEISQVSKLVQKLFKADKLNVAALGNMVPQLHIHVIARYKTDLVFPKPVWVDSRSEAYKAGEAEKIIAEIAALL